MLLVRLTGFEERETFNIRIRKTDSVETLYHMLLSFLSTRRITNKQKRSVVFKWNQRDIGQTEKSDCSAFFEGQNIVHIRTYLSELRNGMGQNRKRKYSDETDIMTPTFRRVRTHTPYDSDISNSFWKTWCTDLIKVPHQRRRRNRPSCRGPIDRTRLIPSETHPKWAIASPKRSSSNLRDIDGSSASSWYLIECLRDVRMRKSTEKSGRWIREFRVKWQGWRKHTWEPEENIHPETVRSFLRDALVDEKHTRKVGSLVRSQRHGSGRIIQICSCKRLRAPHASVHFSSKENVICVNLRNLVEIESFDVSS